MRHLTAVATLVLALLLVTGCTSEGVVAFQRDQTAADLLDVDFEALNVERDSARFLAEEGGVRYVVARGDGDTLCLVSVRPGEPDSAESYCAAHGLGLQSSSGHKLELVVPDMDERPGWRKLAPNLYVQE